MLKKVLPCATSWGSPWHPWNPSTPAGLPSSNLPDKQSNCQTLSNIDVLVSFGATGGLFLRCGLQETGEVHGGIRRHLDGPKLDFTTFTTRHSPLRHFTCAIATTTAIILPGVFLAKTSTSTWLVHRKHHAEIAYDARIGGWFYCACPIAQYFGDIQQAQNSWRPELVWEISSRGGRKFYGEAPVAFLDLELSQESSTMTWETFRKPKIPLYTQFQLSS